MNLKTFTKINTTVTQNLVLRTFFLHGNHHSLL